MKKLAEAGLKLYGQAALSVIVTGLIVSSVLITQARRITELLEIEDSKIVPSIPPRSILRIGLILVCLNFTLYILRMFFADVLVWVGAGFQRPILLRIIFGTLPAIMLPVVILMKSDAISRILERFPNPSASE